MRFILCLLFLILCRQNQSAEISFNLQQNNIGLVQKGHILALDKEAYWLGRQAGTTPVWEYRFYLPQATTNFHLQITYEGYLSFLLFNPNNPVAESKKPIILPTASQKTIFEKYYYFPKPTNELVLRVFFDAKKEGFLGSVKLDNRNNLPLIGFDERFQFQPDKRLFSKQKLADFPLGVNLEAGYLFYDLNSTERTKLLTQIVFDGFSAIRLHKLYRVLVQENFHPQLWQEVQSFFQEIFAHQLDLYLDIISWPPAINGIEEGWKQSFFLEPKLQNKALDWLDKLHGIPVDGLPLLSHPRLKWLCLINENSLFFEESLATKLKTWQLYDQYLNDRNMGTGNMGTGTKNNSLKKKFLGLSTWKQQTMLAVYEKFFTILQEKYQFFVPNNTLIDNQPNKHQPSAQKYFFLSNYEAIGFDLQTNAMASKAIDRHLYFDYPDFHAKRPRVQNLSLIDHRNTYLQRWQNLFSATEINYISECNLPWPNRFQHELIPVLLYLHKHKPIQGLWFYDYRLRTHNFHSGGIFGIQKFHSIIGQLPYLKKLWSTNYKIEELATGIVISGQGLHCFSGRTSKGVPLSLWQSDHHTEIFSLEKADGDTFDLLNLEQYDLGQKPLQLQTSPISNPSDTDN